jgi:hypothetical protein
VVPAVEHQHDFASGHLAGEADHLGVRLRGGERELPLRQPVAPGQVLGDRDRVLAGQQELGAVLHPTGDCIDDRVRRVAAEGAHVRDVHVEIGVPVDVCELGALAVGHPDRRVVVEVVHPHHRHAARHRTAGLLLERQGSGPFGNEASVLRLLELSHACGVDAGRVRHAYPGRMISTFSCDIAYSDSPAASRASASLRNMCHHMHFSWRHFTVCQYLCSKDASLSAPCPRRRPAQP